MSLKTSKPNRRFQRTATLLMLAVYLFFTLGDMALEVMHKITHAWQSRAEASHSHGHGSRVHSHGEVQHQHEFLAFLNQLVGSSENKNPLEIEVKIEVDKHLIQDEKFNMSQYSYAYIKHFSDCSVLLLRRHPWAKIHPPDHK